MKQTFLIGQPLSLDVEWYDRVPEPEERITYAGEIVGWKQTQVVVRIKDYAVCRFWKKNGLEVGNRDAERRGFRVELSKLDRPKTPDGIPITIDTDA